MNKRGYKNKDKDTKRLHVENNSVYDWQPARWILGGPWRRLYKPFYSSLPSVIPSNMVLDRGW